jgi:hypothetical protein
VRTKRRSIHLCLASVGAVLTGLESRICYARILASSCLMAQAGCQHSAVLLCRKQELTAVILLSPCWSLSCLVGLA